MWRFTNGNESKTPPKRHTETGRILFSQSDAVIYKSVETVVEVDEAVCYLTEFLNPLDLSGSLCTYCNENLSVNNYAQPAKALQRNGAFSKNIKEQRRRTKHFDRNFPR